MLIEDYEGEFYESTIGDRIFTEAANKLRDALKEEVNAMINAVIEENKSLKKRNSELSKKISNIDDDRREFEASKQSVIKKAISDYIREKFGGFIWGDEVWMVREEVSYKTCGHCNGTHKVSANIAGIIKTVDCPHCDYNGKIVDNKIFVPVKRIISQSNLKIWNENKTYEREFYLKELKGCTDHIWNVDIGKTVFITEEECLTACEEKQNKWNKEHQI